MSGNPWKLTAIGLALMGVTALATGLVVASWSDRDEPEVKAPSDQPGGRQGAPPRPASRPAPSRVAAAAPAATPAPANPGVPSQAVVDACNRQAAQQSGERDKTVDVVKESAIGAVVGAVVGAAGGAIADGGSGAGKGAAIGGVAGAGAGALYGLNENRKHDERYREVYGACLRSRGYTG
jgi:hypothetical protein